MRIEHAAIYVNDIEAEKEFFARYFVASAGEMYHNKNTGFRSYFLSFDGGARLELMTAPGLQNIDRPPLRTGLCASGVFRRQPRGGRRTHRTAEGGRLCRRERAESDRGRVL